jgi:hypothetical protein
MMSSIGAAISEGIVDVSSGFEEGQLPVCVTTLGSIQPVANTGEFDSDMLWYLQC